MPFVMVSDLDEQSRHPTKFEWHSRIKRGVLRRRSDGNYSFHWLDALNVTSVTSTRNRSMEFSEVIKWGNMLWAACDATGILYKLKLAPTEAFAFQRFALADGDGNMPKAFKSEWAARKNGKMIVGSHGKEWTQGGKILGRGSEWIKVVDRHGRIENYDWGPRYQRLRAATNTTFPGYLTHEAVVWHEELGRWVFLPRKASFGEPYHDARDEQRGSNLMLLVDRRFSSVEVRLLGDLEPEWGVTSVKRVPHTETLLIATKVRERGGSAETRIGVFDLTGRFYSDPPWADVEGVKYEGLEFLDIP